MSDVETENVVEEQNATDKTSQKETVINALIKEFVEIKEAIKQTEENLRYWGSQDAKLSASNWAMELECEKLFKKLEQLKETYAENFEIDERKTRERCSLEEERSEKEEARWIDIQLEITKYADKFPNALTEYASTNLQKDIDELRKEREKYETNNGIIRDKLKSLENICDLDNEQNNFDSLSNLNVISSNKAYDNFLSNKITSMEYTLQNLHSKIKKSKATLDDGYKKEKKRRILSCDIDKLKSLCSWY